MTFNFITLTFSLISFLLVVLLCGPNRFDRFYKNFTLLMSAIIFFSTLQIWFNCSWSSVSYPIYSKFLNVVDLQCLFVVDTTSLFFILITTFLFPFCILASWEMSQIRLLYFNLVLIELTLVLTFTVFDMFLFCLFFEAVLIPMFFIILWWGSRDRRIKALTYFFIYTLLGSVFLFLALFAIYYEIGSTSFFSLYQWTSLHTHFKQGLFVINYISLILFFVFAVKIPVFPFHIWLPEAHVEAPTVGSVILAGLLLKLGGYGVLRFMYMFLESLEYWQIFILVLLVLSIWLGSILATRQLDLKRIIAYSSIAHMNFALIGVFINSALGVAGAYSLFLSHGIVSSALFLIVGFIYDRHHTRLLHYYGGLVQVMPLWVFFFFAFIASNFSFPGTSNFIGELLIFIALGEFTLSPLLLLVVGFSTFLTVVYSLFMFNRISFGTLKIQYLGAFSDLTRREFFLMLPLFILNLFFGLCPNIFLAPIYHSSLITLNNAQFPTEWLFSTTRPQRFFFSPEDEFIIDMVSFQLSIDKTSSYAFIEAAIADTPLVDFESEAAMLVEAMKYCEKHSLKMNSELEALDLFKSESAFSAIQVWNLVMQHYQPSLKTFLMPIEEFESRVSEWCSVNPYICEDWVLAAMCRGDAQLYMSSAIASRRLFASDQSLYVVRGYDMSYPYLFIVHNSDRYGRSTVLVERAFLEAPFFDEDFGKFLQ